MIVLGSLLRTDDNSRPESQCRSFGLRLPVFWPLKTYRAASRVLRRKQYNLLDRYALESYLARQGNLMLYREKCATVSGGGDGGGGTFRLYLPPSGGGKR